MTGLMILLSPANENMTLRDAQESASLAQWDEVGADDVKEDKIPSAPTRWTVELEMSMMELGALPATLPPKWKTTMESRIMLRWPKMLESWSKTGCGTRARKSAGAGDQNVVLMTAGFPGDCR